MIASAYAIISGTLFALAIGLVLVGPWCERKAAEMRRDLDRIRDSNT